MINIQKNQENNSVFTLGERTTLVGALYLLEIFSNQNHDSRVIRLSSDTSTNLFRYNEFKITEVPIGSEDFELAKINLEPGSYDYFAWQTTASTLSYRLASTIHLLQ